MNFYCDSGGKIFHVDAKNVYQGGVNAQDIYFIGAFPSNSTVTVAYLLQNGAYTEPQLLTRENNTELSEIQTTKGMKYNVWHAKLENQVTQEYGTVGVQFFVSNNGEKIPTELSSFEVMRGVPVEIPDAIGDENLLNDILQALAKVNTVVTFARLI